MEVHVAEAVAADLDPLGLAGEAVGDLHGRSRGVGDANESRRAGRGKYRRRHRCDVIDPARQLEPEAAVADLLARDLCPVTCPLDRHGDRIGVRRLGERLGAGSCSARSAGSGAGRVEDGAVDAGGLVVAALAGVRGGREQGDQAEDRERCRDSWNQPPATAGRIVTSSPSLTAVSRPSWKRMSSPET
jgi:hypothetical protein